ncbi:MAG: Crp/Fnr family transcriptional regulator [Paludibacterium sp.]|uniref:Crp/Fnr family transcriptional regulator n=1 Tax=Paludibacterium sp. TaxID=1917523 RepID=UPI002600BC2B|nr:Crp/Fnr family transcriptional regulator [Paludibacterium sp.]MBV8049151.1 Crp/Fnr family transcriptional regulator [Paludibacterium sp.]MBV8648825.1 Crp/Fnr family transcriptional regulator [Paludibacterium sp.]
MPHVDIPTLLRHQPLFQALSPEQLAVLLPHVREVRCDKGRVLFQKGDPCDGMYVVVYGRVKLSLFSAQGSEKVVEVIQPGQSLAEAVMFLGYAYPVLAQCLDDTLLLKIDSAGILGALGGDGDFARRLLAGMSMRLHGLIRDVERYSTESSLQRVSGYLQQAWVDAGEPDSAFPLPLNKNLIASRLNLTPETFSRVLQRLMTAQLIQVAGREVRVLDPEGLREFAGEEKG